MFHLTQALGTVFSDSFNMHGIDQQVAEIRDLNQWGVPNGTVASSKQLERAWFGGSSELFMSG